MQVVGVIVTNNEVTITPLSSKNLTASRLRTFDSDVDDRLLLDVQMKKMAEY